MYNSCYWTDFPEQKNLIHNDLSSTEKRDVWMILKVYVAAIVFDQFLIEWQLTFMERIDCYQEDIEDDTRNKK